MIYFGNSCGNQKIIEAMQQKILGLITTPSGRKSPEGFPIWVADNGCFGKRYVGDEKYLEWLQKYQPYTSQCLFATAPDVVGDYEATYLRSLPFLPKIKALGYKTAFVAQDGVEFSDIPWNSFDVLFIGGTTEWKLGKGARGITYVAKFKDKWVHMGRVNSFKRLKYAQTIGCDSVDGTYLTYGPEKNLPNLLSWLDML